jgi:hypothetical protein
LNPISSFKVVGNDLSKLDGGQWSYVIIRPQDIGTFAHLFFSLIRWIV